MIACARHCTFLFLASLLLAGSASSTPALQFTEVNIDARSYSPAVEDFMILMDASQSMGHWTIRQAKLEVATELARAMAASIPELNYRAGVRSFGQGDCLPNERTSLLTGMQRFSHGDLLSAIDRVRCVGNGSPLDVALDALVSDFGSSRKKTAVFVLSDGLEMGEDEVYAARRLHDATGACIYAIQIGRHASGAALLQRVVQAAGCGSVLSAEELTDPAALKQLITSALLTGDQDRDGDGVPDSRDRCPGTPRGVAVDANGCPRDSDGDGVTDDKDRCPDTPRGTPVDARGCAVVEVVGEAWRVPGEVLFATGSAVLRDEARRVLQDIASFLKRNRDVRLMIEGHTDDRGAAEMNMKLSRLRAESTKVFLVRQGVDETRLSTQGMGESKPAVPNDTPANRSKNRRIEFRPLK